MFFVFFSSFFSGITNSSGIASVTVSNVSSETTFTASYSNVSATCTVTVQSVTVYYESALTSDDGKWQKSSSSGMNITYNNTGLTCAGTTTSDRTYYIDNSSVTIPTSDIQVDVDIIAYSLGAYDNSTELVIHNTKLVYNAANLNILTFNGSQIEVTDKNLPKHVTAKITSSKIEIYLDNVYIGQTSVNSSNRKIGLKTYNNRSMTIKNLTVTELQ